MSEKAARAVRTAIEKDLKSAMNEFNRRDKEKESKSEG
jgi:hypothetical protein